MKKTVLIFLICWFPLYAQVLPDSAVALPADSLLSDSLLTDSLTVKKPSAEKKVPVVLNLAAFDTLNKEYHPFSIVYDFKNNILTSYTGFADAFRNYSAFQIFDFLDIGMPQYAAGLNLMPHQTRLNFNGSEANDPISGMFNSRFIRLDEVKQIKTSEKYTGSNEISAETISAVTDTPLTRIMYREGDFGYSVLDIQFNRKINDRLSIGLSGLNSDYDNTLFHGVVYSGTIHYQLTQQIYSRTRIYINQDEMRSKNFSDFPDHKYKERRDEISQDFYRHHDGGNGSWHLWLYGASSWRTRRFPLEAKKLQYKYDRWQTGAEYSRQLDNLSAGVKFLAQQDKIWGNVFSRKYTDSSLKGTVKAAYKINAAASLHSAVTMQTRLGYGMLFNPQLSSRLNFNTFKTHFYVNEESRNPLRIEESINSYPYSGSKNLADERIRTAGASAEYSPLQKLSLSFSGGYSQIKNEIRFNGTSFYNGPVRDFTFVAGGLKFGFYKFHLSAGGQANFADIHTSPSRSLWLQGGCHDTWFNGALITDAVGNIYLYDEFNELKFNPAAERFYWTDETRSGYYMLSYKLAATIKNAQLYFAMDNPLSDEYFIIKGYSEYYRRVRFGLNWILWN